MNGNLLRSQGLLAIAVGAGVVIGAAGVFLYEHLFKEKRRLILQKDVTKLGISISELKKELQELRYFLFVYISNDIKFLFETLLPTDLYFYNIT